MTTTSERLPTRSLKSIASHCRLTWPVPFSRLMVVGGIAYIDAGDIRDKSAAGFVSRNNDPRKTSAAEQLSAAGVRNHDLAAAEERIELTDSKYGLIAIGARHDDDLMEDVVFDGRVRDDPVDGRVVQEVP